jgi:arylsulfatase A-like enzyme
LHLRLTGSLTRSIVASPAYPNSAESSVLQGGDFVMPAMFVHPCVDRFVGGESEHPSLDLDGNALAAVLDADVVTKCFSCSLFKAEAVQMGERFRPTRRQAIASLAMAPLCVLSRFALAKAALSRPNIVFIMADDLGYADLSCYGRPDFQTPNIDRLASQGMKFTQAYANSAVCSATRTALITGRYQDRLRVGLEEPLSGPGQHIGLPPQHPTLPSLLKKAGYGTTLIGKWHLGWLPDYGPLQSGYDHFYGFRGGAVDYFTHKPGVGPTVEEDLWDQDAQVHEVGYLTELLGDRAVSVINDYASKDSPFLLSLHFNAPHWPWEGPKDEAESRRISGLRDYDGGSQKTYARMVMDMDVEVGRVMEALAKSHAAQNTMVIFTSDNGGERFADTWPFTGKKSELLEGGLRIPALVRWPRVIQEGVVSDQVMITMDWLPTLLEAAAASQDPAFPSDGMSLVPALTQAVPPVPRRLFWRFKSNSQRAVRDGDMKWLKIRDNTFLFNVVTDPLERANLKDRQPEVYRRLADEFAAWDATMLPEDPRSYSEQIIGKTWADHYGSAPD